MEITAGRPRNELIDKKILEAAVSILTEKGYSGLKMDLVATRAKISKRTLYLRYKSVAQLVIDLLHELATTTVEIPDTGELKSDLVEVLSHIEMLFKKTLFGVIMPILVSASVDNPDLAKLGREYLKSRRKLMEPIVIRAIERGELPDSTDPNMFIELCVAPVYYRNLISAEPVDEAYIMKVIDFIKLKDAEL